LPGDRQVGVGDGGECIAAADERGYGFAAKAHMRLGEHRLILGVGENAE
jgi:hypothetical protein